ncbi:uncharacterized protein EDB93DRAFT_1155069 [Suillus bovinus]|uniref:uncharacterized protein n=1 Tax=Suillus bovinus TaxID=48563 RepID=UPI001B87622E|nr:uncharacterized protein EDB93DRAFT_1155069 [Suillus bovinus]KAG2143826.1 hypothetical protein EDB93DRAFT_1155069 [Suillus bovinus]
MSYDQGNQRSRDFDDSSKYDAPIGGQRTVPGGDPTLSGSYGGSRTGQAGGYTGNGNEGRVGRQDQQSLNQGDEYCDTDPGMAGNRGGQDVDVLGAGQVGGGYDDTFDQCIIGDGRSRGYERDVDEYEDSGVGGGQAGTGTGTGAATGRGPKLSSMGSKFMGEV